MEIIHSFWSVSASAIDLIMGFETILLSKQAGEKWCHHLYVWESDVK